MIEDKYTCYYPKSRENMKTFPEGTTATSLRHYPSLTDEDLFSLPDTIEKLYIACCANIVHLKGLHHLVNLKYLDIDVCCNITQDALDDVKKALPNVDVNTWGCWQLAKTCPEVQQQEDDLFVNVLGVMPPRLYEQIIACEE